MEDFIPIKSGLRPRIIPNSDEPEDSEPQDPEVYYYVLQTGRIAGPFSIKRVVEMALTRTVKGSDFVQVAGSADWKLLPVAIDPSVPPPEGTSPAPDWMTIASWAWLTARWTEILSCVVAFCLRTAIISRAALIWRNGRRR